MTSLTIQPNQWYDIIIPLPNKITFDSVLRLQEELRKKKISFDYTFGPIGGEKRWQLDWSLEGGTPVQITEVLDKNEIEYRVIQKGKRDGKWFYEELKK